MGKLALILPLSPQRILNPTFGPWTSLQYKPHGWVSHTVDSFQINRESSTESDLIPPLQGSTPCVCDFLLVTQTRSVHQCLNVEIINLKAFYSSDCKLLKFWLKKWVRLRGMALAPSRPEKAAGFPVWQFWFCAVIDWFCRRSRAHKSLINHLKL